MVKRNPCYNDRLNIVQEFRAIPSEQAPAKYLKAGSAPSRASADISDTISALLTKELRIIKYAQNVADGVPIQYENAGTYPSLEQISSAMADLD